MYKRILFAAALFFMAAVYTANAEGAVPYGAVVSLQGTPHLWIADEQGILHWGGDTRALTGKHVRWDNRIEVSLDQLRSMSIGDPWLSSGLLKDGDPIYLVKWETDWEQPKLLHILSIRDVELFGINGKNYGHFVLEKSTWEQRYNILAATLEQAVLASATRQFRVDLRALANQYIMPHLPSTFRHAGRNPPYVPISDVELHYYDDQECEKAARESTGALGYFSFEDDAYAICVNSGLVEQEAEDRGISVEEQTLLVLVHEYAHPLTIRLVVACDRRYSGDAYDDCVHNHWLTDGSKSGNFQVTCKELTDAILPASRFDPC